MVSDNFGYKGIYDSAKHNIKTIIVGYGKTGI